MALFTASINSGSNGNCYYIGNTDEAVLVDIGISCRELEKRMLRSGLSLKKVKAIFISHEHTDHISGVEVVSKKHKIPVYISRGTFSNSGLSLEYDLNKNFKAYEPVIIGGITVIPFPKLHDANDPYSFIVEQNGIRIGVMTDIGDHCDHVISNFKKCHAAFLEANYDVQMLENGRYPYYLKKRISGGKGHLSNDQALELFIKYRSENLSHVFLSHLSKDNNSPEIVHELFQKHAGSTRIIVASRFKETEIFTITGKQESYTENVIEGKINVQMSLF